MYSHLDEHVVSMVKTVDICRSHPLPNTTTVTHTHTIRLTLLHLLLVASLPPSLSSVMFTFWVVHRQKYHHLLNS